MSEQFNRFVDYIVFIRPALPSSFEGAFSLLGAEKNKALGVPNHIQAWTFRCLPTGNMQFIYDLLENVSKKSKDDIQYYIAEVCNSKASEKLREQMYSAHK
ncbi:hypothetical protein KCM76_19900 [Zooshikella marina]|uniref:hypothetical protein n=1 Tax=Zooshikella ganghwensis TaxID=202772 RepID=UPI001BAF5B02|nr:hypothetical protein [Zooshikella ganghwensis]MBU2708265.1 hypothetical protein [Zooshikella ganghwensis]